MYLEITRKDKTYIYGTPSKLGGHQNLTIAPNVVEVTNNENASPGEETRQDISYNDLNVGAELEVLADHSYPSPSKVTQDSQDLMKTGCRICNVESTIRVLGGG